MYKAALFPYDAHSLPLVRHFNDFQNEYELVKIYSLPGSGLDGHDAAYACNQPEVGRLIECPICLDSCEWDTLILMRQYVNSDDMAKRIVHEALLAGKRVLCLEGKEESVPKWLKEISSDCQELQIKTLRSFHSDGWDSTYIQDIDTPVILIGGFIGGSDTLEIVLSVSKALQQNGLDVITVTQEPVASLFDYISVQPPKMFSDNLPEYIRSIKAQFWKIEKEYMPDIIVVEAPDAMIQYSKLVPNGYGIYTYMLCSAIAPDHCICCVPHNMAIPELINEISNDFFTRYGVTIDIVHISNLIVDGAKTFETRNMCTFYDNFETAYDIASRIGEFQRDVLFVNAIRDCRSFSQMIMRIVEG